MCATAPDMGTNNVALDYAKVIWYYQQPSPSGASISYSITPLGIYHTDQQTQSGYTFTNGYPYFGPGRWSYGGGENCNYAQVPPCVVNGGYSIFEVDTVPQTTTMEQWPQSYITSCALYCGTLPPSPSPSPMPPPNPHTYPDNGPDYLAHAQDNSERDQCISSLDLPTTAFDPNTGKVDLGNPDANFFAAAPVEGAKPGQACMPLKNTPVDDLTGFTNPNTVNQAYRDWLHIGIPAQNGSPAVTDATTATDLASLGSSIYDWSNTEKTILGRYEQPVGGPEDCQDMLVPTFTLLSNPPGTPPSTTLTPIDKQNIAMLAKFRMAQIYNCAAQFMKRGEIPWDVYEPETSDIQVYLHPTGPNPPPPGNAMEVAAQLCQHIDKGYRAGQPPDSGNAERVYLGLMQQRDAQFAEIPYSPKRPWFTEASISAYYTQGDYSLPDMIQQSELDTLVNGTQEYTSLGAAISPSAIIQPPSPFPLSTLPCIVNVDISPSPAPAPYSAGSSSSSSSGGPTPSCPPLTQYAANLICMATVSTSSTAVDYKQGGVMTNQYLTGKFPSVSSIPVLADDYCIVDCAVPPAPGPAPAPAPAQQIQPPPPPGAMLQEREEHYLHTLNEAAAQLVAEVLDVRETEAQ